MIEPSRIKEGEFVTLQGAAAARYYTFAGAARPMLVARVFSTCPLLVDCLCWDNQIRTFVYRELEWMSPEAAAFYSKD